MIDTTYHIDGVPRIALLSDSHNANPAHILASLRSHSPQLILISGDFVYGQKPSIPKQLKIKESQNAITLLRKCVTIAPTFVSLGNHERILVAADIEIISATGVVLLDNEWTSCVLDGKKIVIGGLSSADVTEYRRWRKTQESEELYPPAATFYRSMKNRSRQPDLSWITAMEQEEGYKVLLCHHPEYWPLLRSYNIDLILSGHAHGGQIRLFGHGLYSPGQGFFPALTSGIIDNRLVISRGLSNTYIIPRLWNPIEVVYIE